RTPAPPAPLPPSPPRTPAPPPPPPVPPTQRRSSRGPGRGAAPGAAARTAQAPGPPSSRPSLRSLPLRGYEGRRRERVGADSAASSAGPGGIWADREQGVFLGSEAPAADDPAGASEPFARGGIPGGEAAGPVQRQDARAVPAEGGDRAEVVRDAQGLTHGAQVCRIPEADRAVCARAENDTATRCECGCVHPARVGHPRAGNQVARRGVEYCDRPVQRSGDDPAAVG